MQTGVTALGLLLLRVADPQFETEAAESFGFKQIVYEPLMGGGFITASAPILIVSFGVAFNLHRGTCIHRGGTGDCVLFGLDSVFAGSNTNVGGREPGSVTQSKESSHSSV